MLATASTREIGRGIGKNASELTGRVEISKEEIPGRKNRWRKNPNLKTTRIHTVTLVICLYKTLQRCLDEPAKKYTRPVIMSMEESSTKIDVFFKRVGKDVDGSTGTKPFQKRNTHLDGS